eukprot:SAG31_NODE_3345_length_4377_cov_3.568256_6_plen_254_part_00
MADENDETDNASLVSCEDGGDILHSIPLPPSMPQSVPDAPDLDKAAATESMYSRSHVQTEFLHEPQERGASERRLLEVSRHHPRMLVGRRPSDSRPPNDQLRLATSPGTVANADDCAVAAFPIHYQTMSAGADPAPADTGVAAPSYFEVFGDSTAASDRDRNRHLCIGVSLLPSHSLDTAPGLCPGSVGLVRMQSSSKILKHDDMMSDVCIRRIQRPGCCTPVKILSRWCAAPPMCWKWMEATLETKALRGQW